MAENYSTRTPGQLLRAAREARDCSLNGAHEGTKISLRLIEAMERDEYHKLSGPLYVKSFLRNYATWLGLDAEQILQVYELATGRPEQTPSADDLVWTEDQVAVTRVGVPWTRLVIIAVAAVILILVLVWVGIRVFSGGGDDDTALVTSAAVVADPVAAQSEVAVADSVGTRSPVQAEFQPDTRDESAEERLARLSRDNLGGTGTAQEVVKSAPVVAPTVALEPPRRGAADLRFTDGQTFPLVLRVVIPEPANCSVRRDDQPAATPVIWPDKPGPPPAYNLKHGLAYAVRGGYAVYWGAEDHFTLTLDRVQGVSVTLNGAILSLTNWRPGQTKLLDSSSLATGN